ncbi:multiple sugar transport system substrate-binding protein [Streptomyces griseochromogenes]|uniref:ABC transporter substrate-binding protein n=1 Tax=Streptomyces griseochromogenes TaxID=68214 RepID=A0A1B1B029_9ACTN|nr:ABC transporter substrate-binding protein [Streptomyces griseochromogenes]ANP52169.1 ABC transporter substrate-binding protein [Streptomyces griseochromogenes]MBP2055231.1 multiple sugar transport system substrate-binding protein [Streptomyces griseochromogenes]
MKIRTTRALQCSTALAAAGLLVTACGSSGDGGAGASAGSTSFQGRGPITYVAGKDTSGVVPKVIDRWNRLHPKEKVTFIQLPTDADSQRQQMIQNAETKSDAYTVLSLDVVWTSEFAAHQWIDRLPEKQFPLRTMLKPVVETAKYRGNLYAAPASSDGGLLYYRTDLLKKAGVTRPPATWSEMTADCAKVKKLPEAKGMSCYAGQFQKYEGLTVNFAEAVNSAGGVVTDANGRPHVDTPEAKKGLDFLAGSVKDGTIPKEAVTYQEEDGRQAFQSGKLIFLRNWPYVYALAEKSKAAGKFAVAPLPGLNGPGSSSLGGHNLALSSFAKNKATALDFMKFFSSEDSAGTFLRDASLAPPYTDLYDNASLVKQYPYLPVLKQSILRAVPRPRVVQYGDVTSAIQQETYAALTGSKSSTQALKDLQNDLQHATAQ